jgi:hypothetical protein
MLGSLNVLGISEHWEKEKTECAPNLEVFGVVKSPKSHKSKDIRREYCIHG